jgi:hypothetical protein
MDIDDFLVEIRKINKGKGSMRGVASVSYLDKEKNGFKMIGFKILKGMYSVGYEDTDGSFLWVAPPSFSDPVTSKIVNSFYMPQDLWNQLQAKILEQYIGANSKKD